MAANNFFGYPAPHAQPPGNPAAYAAGAPQPPPPPPAAAYSANPVAAVAAAVQQQQQQQQQPPPPPPPNAAVAYNQAAAAAAAAASVAASSYRSAPQAVVAYSAYQPAAAAAAAAAASGATYGGSYQAPAYTQYPTQPAGTQLYDPSKSAAPTFYAAAAQPSGVAVTVTYSVSDPHYQARPVYSANSSVAMVARPAAIITGPPRPSYTTYAQSSTTQSFSYGTQSPLSAAASTVGAKHIYVQNPPATVTLNVTPVPPAVGSMKVHQPPPHHALQQQQHQQWGRQGKNMMAMGPQGLPPMGAGSKGFKPKPAPKPQQLHYCEVCKISCAGPQTYKEHLEGQKHKKKEAALKSGSPAPTTRGGNALRCELCDVTCTGSDAYAAHIRGAKHQKVVKLHTKLGKPIPSGDPVLVTKSQEQEQHQQHQQQQHQQHPPPPGKSQSSSKQPLNPYPKITFVASGQSKPDTTKSEATKTISIPTPSSSASTSNTVEVTIPRLPDERDVQPVGHDYIEEIKNDEGKVVSFNCKLCECRFNDPNAKEMHMKGRRHRLQYKKKVNPDLIVDVKPSLRQRKLAEEKAKKFQAKEEFWRRREEEFKVMEEEENAFWEERRKYEDEDAMTDGPGAPSMFMSPHPPHPGPPRMMGPRPFMPIGVPHPPFMYGGFPPLPHHPGPGMMMRRPETSDDRHIMSKHAEIFPEEDWLENLQRIILNIEKALKSVSDKITIGCLSGAGEKKKDEENCQSTAKKEERVLKGVMRVGALAKGLVLKGERKLRLIILCSVKPTKRLLSRICELLPSELEELKKDKFALTENVNEASFTLKLSDFSIDISVTSPLMRDETSGPHPDDILSPEKCLESLAILRQTKWFQARAQGRHSCVIVLRILRDLSQRVQSWSVVKPFVLELLVEKVLATATMPLSPGEAFRRFFEAVAGGILLKSNAPGLLDPCEKEPSDAARDLTPQQREDITMDAQVSLRLIAFRQIYKVLDIDLLQPPSSKFAGHVRFSDNGARKRRRDEDSSAAMEVDNGEQDGKKDKFDEEKDPNGTEDENNLNDEEMADNGGRESSNK